jgi:hypothetical protein
MELLQNFGSLLLDAYSKYYLKLPPYTDSDDDFGSGIGSLPTPFSDFMVAPKRTIS